MNFDSQMKFGQAGESAIAQWFRHRGHNVMPVYEKIIDTGKGPQFFLPKGESLIAPDMLVFKSDEIIWIEAKHKTAFSWYRKMNYWVTGIDLRHYNDYLRVAEVSKIDVWLLFLHKGGQAKDSPKESPAGLFGNRLNHLRKHESHRSDFGNSGMVYWAIHKLILIASMEEVEIATDHKRACQLTPR